MKSQLLALVATFLFIQVQAQERRQDIVIDWQELDKSIRETTLLDAIEHGRLHSFKIENINKFLFEVTLEGKRVELETPVPTELQTLFRLNREGLVQSGSTAEMDKELEGLDDDKNDMNTIIGLIMKPIENEKVELISQMNTNNEEIEKIKKNNLKSISAKSKRINDLEISTLEQESIMLLLQAKTLDEKIDRLEEFKTAVRSYVLKVREVQNELQKLKLTRIELIILAQKDISWKEMKREINKIKKPVKGQLSHNELTKQFNSINDMYQEISKESNITEKEALKTYYKKLNDSFKILDETSFLSIYSEVNFLYSELNNENNFIVVAPPTQADGDLINFEVTVTPDQINILGPNRNPVNFDFDIPVKGGLKVDFSVGPVLSFGDGARDEKFFLEESETEDMAILREQDNNNAINPGVGAFMHFYRRSGTQTALGGLFGVGAGFQDVDDVNLSFYTGASLVMGRKQKVILSAGISFLNVERLRDDEFEIGTAYNTIDFDVNNVSEKIFRSSFFLSLTYNITNRVER